MAYQTSADKPLDVSDYNRMYLEAEACDAEDFAEKRSNVLLFAGEHFNRRRLNLYRRLQGFDEISKEHRVRLTKNHIQNICKIYANNIVSAAPGVGFRPKNEKEIQDQKLAELHRLLWQDAKHKYALDEKLDDWVDALVVLGEVAVKIFYDPYSQVSGQRFVFEDVFGFNLLRPPSCKDLRKAEWLCIRKMVDKNDLLMAFGAEEDKRRFINASVDETMKVFDAHKASYVESQNQVLLREFYFRPCAKYPNGWFSYSTKEGILAEGELPFGVFPIVVSCFDRAPTSCRGIGPIKIMRPYQVEINRCSSKIAEHHVTLGDDKIILQNGAKFTPTAAFPGIRAYGATGGQAPVILQGRDGSQFVNHLQNTITELYQVMNVAEDGLEKQDPAQMDPYALLFRSAKQKKRFQRYIKRIERFQIEIARTYLTLAKNSLDDEELISILGRDEVANIEELRAQPDTHYEIVIEGADDDAETKLGRQLMINNAMQYAGNHLSRDDLGKLLRVSPLGSFEGMFSDMTTNYDNLVNDILALDRGERPPVHPKDDHVYMIKGLSARIRKPDFKNLPAEVRMNYQAKIMLHDKFEAFNQLQIQRAKQGYIPTGGYLVVCDLYVPKPDDPTKTQRARIPYESLNWLIRQLAAQHMGLAQLEAMDSSQQVGIAQQINAANQNPAA